jgi:hypothetical protein
MRQKQREGFRTGGKVKVVVGATKIQRNERHGDSWLQTAMNQGGAGMGLSSQAAASLPGITAGVSRATG